VSDFWLIVLDKTRLDLLYMDIEKAQCLEINQLPAYNVQPNLPPESANQIGWNWPITTEEEVHVQHVKVHVKSNSHRS